VIAGGGPLSPRLHLATHQVVANQLLADDPPKTWQTAQRLAGPGHDWHNIMHMIAAVAGDDVYRAMKQHRPFDPGDYARRLNELPGGWPPPQALRPHRPRAHNDLSDGPDGQPKPCDSHPAGRRARARSRTNHGK
jgi:hypothetical protein